MLTRLRQALADSPELGATIHLGVTPEFGWQLAIHGQFEKIGEWDGGG